MHWLMKALMRRGIAEPTQNPRFRGDDAPDQLCPLSRALDVLGHRWLLLIVRELMIAPRRFTGLQRALPGLSSNMLKDRLERLDDLGLLEVKAIRASSKVYCLRGAALYLRPVLGEIAAWGVGWMDCVGADAHFSPAWMKWWFSFWLDEWEIVQPLSLEVHVDALVFGVELRPPAATVQEGPAPHADAVLRITGDEVRRRSTGALITGRHVGGDEALAATLRRIFPFLDVALPSAAGPSRHRGRERSYCQLCPLSVALDLVGEAWTLNIVRDVSIRPQTFSALLANNPGLHSQLLSKRLSKLRRHGLVNKSGEGRGAGYEIAGVGRSLNRVFIALAYWSLWEMPPAKGPDWFLNPEWMINWYRIHFRPEASAGWSICCQQYAGAYALWVSVEDGRLKTGVGEAPNPTCVVRAPLSVWLDASMSETYAMMAFARGWATYEGAFHHIMVLYTMFRFPGRAPANEARIFRATG